MLYSLIIIVITLAVDIVTDLHRWMNDKPINHTRGALLRLIGVVPAVWIYWPTSLLLPLYWVLFDGLLASLKGLGFFYLGETSWLDREQAAHRWLQVAKYTLAAAGILQFFIYA